MMEDILLTWLNKIPLWSTINNSYLEAGILIVLSIVLAQILLLLFGQYLKKFAKKTKTKLDDLIFERTRKPLFYLILVYGLRLATISLGINGFVQQIINSLLAIVFIFIILRALDVFLETWGTSFAQKTKSNIDDVLLPLFQKSARVIFVIIAIMWVLAIWEINIGPYLAGVGISGIVLGLALQDALKNIFGGITLVLDKTYIVGDKIKLESGDVGTIHDIGLRSTKMITFDNEIIYVPNGYLANSRVQNYTRPSPKVRTNVEFGVDYGTDIQKVKKIVLKALSEMEGLLDEPAPDVIFLSMGDFALQFKALFWVDQWGEAFGKKLEATEKIYNALNKAKIGIPYPTHTVYMKK
ncbi:mechanosensitive ion channel family protein [Candidatus Woesearchaeota archaeon]|jgi:MscS family membrane protein|nr:mechanosensitive ion channel family protein [Candidatus Woesearchaeota archaeon]MBT4151258.1 mechanosensitive ion channel family protein [Candidatus Woesearchaeota archaeon]MBT4433982.1 mechanosensitive ion channel family protein [Candidatus Woesearchaeota archaeon]MBT7332379.1 mechanosensitive ion channel family protein [Candidatus Woesearchaeota archaeon]